MDEIKSYEWVKHSKLYDVEIGKSESNKVIFYDGKTKKEIEKEFPRLEYDILLAEADYAEINDKKANYYFDDKEIIEFLNSNTKPINDYWNIQVTK